jgi:putative ABC transport system permease protein
MARRAPDLSVFDMRTAREAVDLQFAEVGALASVARTLSLIGVSLAAIGLYGVLSNAVASRRKEIGIRAALGAAPRQLVARMLFAGLLPVAVGLAAGLGAATAAGRLLAGRLFGLTAADPATYAVSLAVIVGVALGACAMPAYRASRVSAATVLREE